MLGIIRKLISKIYYNMNDKITCIILNYHNYSEKLNSGERLY